MKTNVSSQEQMKTNVSSQEQTAINQIVNKITTEAEATVSLNIKESKIMTVGIGNGPVNAIDLALRKALLQDYPTLDSVRLTDYKVRVIDQGSGTEALVRVLIDSTDGNRSWQTMGASSNIIEASWIAVVDSLEYWNLYYN